MINNLKENHTQIARLFEIHVICGRLYNGFLLSFFIRKSIFVLLFFMLAEFFTFKHIETSDFNVSLALQAKKKKEKLLCSFRNNLLPGHK